MSGLRCCDGRVVAAIAAAGPALAQKAGRHPQDARISTARRACRSTRKRRSPARRPMMGVFNNLVMYDQHVPQNSLQVDRARLATSWSWSEDGTELTFQLRQGVKWHDGKPFTAADVKCTWDLLHGKATREAARQPAQGLVPQSRRGHDQRRLRGHLPPEAAAAGVSRAARLGLVAGLSLPCPAARDAAAPDRHRPVQIRRVQAERVHQGRRATRITGRQDRPYLDGIEYTIITNRSTGDPGLRRRQVRHDLRRMSCTVPLLKDIEEPGAAGDLRAGADERQPQPDDQPRRAAVRQPGSAPGDGADARPQGLHRHPRPRARAISAARCCRRRKASGACRRRCCRRCRATAPMSRRTAPRPARSWRSSATAPTSGSRSRCRPATSRRYRDPAVILIDQLKEIYIDGELEPVDTAELVSRRSTRKDYTIGAQPDRQRRSTIPTRQFYENYACGSERNYTGYCNPEIDKLIDEQSMRSRPGEAQASWSGRSSASWPRTWRGRSSSTTAARTCWQPQVKGLTMMVNSIYNGWRMEDVWLDK